MREMRARTNLRSTLEIFLEESDDEPKFEE